MPRRPDTRERLMQATLELLAEHGLSGATTRHIAQKVEVSENTIYRHFADKDALVREAFFTRIDEFTREMDAADDADLATGDRLAKFIGVTVQWARERSGDLRVLLELNALLLRHLDERHDPFDVIRRVLVEGQQRGDVRSGEPGWLTLCLVGLLLRPLQMKDQGLLLVEWPELESAMIQEARRFIAVAGRS